MMKCSKSVSNKQSKQKKVQCNSNKASKFIEKESINGLSLTFSNLPTSLCDFIPKDQDHLSHEHDFDISKNLRKLEKKDALTKQKTLNDLLVMFNEKDEASVISTLRFWPKLYNKLSLDEDKKVREQTQQLMGKYARISGKEISSVIKQLLPTWIISQSDLHSPAANFAKETFIETFPTKTKQEKAYLLCWQSIYEIISGNLSKSVPPNIKPNNVELTSQEEVYIQDVVVNLRTIITLLPFIKDNEDALSDINALLKSKEFWLHFKQNTSVGIIQSVYLQLGVDLLEYLGGNLVMSTPFIANNLCECYRMIDNYHSHLISRIWTAIIKCGEILPRQQIWKFINFPSFFLPRFVKLLNCGADGNISCIYSCMLPLFTQLPVEEDLSPFEQILVAMIRCCECPRVSSSECEANASVQMLYECSLYTIVLASNKGALDIVDKTLSNLLSFTQQLLSGTRFKKCASRGVLVFANCFVSTLLTKSVVSASQIIDVVLVWIDNNHENDFVFCENLTKFFLELSKSDNEKIKEFHDLLLDRVAPLLKLQIIIDQHQPNLVPYFYACSALPSLAISRDEADTILSQCAHLMRDFNPAVTLIISRGISATFSAIDSQEINSFLSSLSPQQVDTFFTRFYQGIISSIDDPSVVESLARSSLSFWKENIGDVVNDLLTEGDDRPHLSWETIFDLCQSISVHNHHHHDADIISHLNSEIECLMDKSISTDCIDRVISLMAVCITKLHSKSCLVPLLPESFIRNLLKLILCNTVTATATARRDDLLPISIYLNDCKASDALFLRISLELIDEAARSQHCPDISLVTHFIQSVLDASPDDRIQQQLIAHLDSMLLDDIVLINGSMAGQIGYSAVPVHTKHDRIINVIHTINVLRPLHLAPLTTNIDCASILINSLALAAFSSCHNSSSLLSKCQNIHKSVASLDLSYFLDQLLRSAANQSTGLVVFDSCPTLVLCSLQQLTPDNYSLWTPAFVASVESAISGWPDAELSTSELVLITRVLLPCATKARFVVQENILATLTSYLPDNDNSRIGDVNRALAIMTSLSRADPSYFHACFPILLHMKPIFQPFIDELHPASLDQSSLQHDAECFLLTALLEFISIGIDSGSTMSQPQWEFVFCLMDTLVRSDQFANTGNYRSQPISDNCDHLLNAHWLLKVVSSATIALASVKLDSVIDEWDNHFSDPIFTAILDQFSLVAGDHTIGKMVYSDLFIFYLESLTDVVSLCPVNILLAHNFTGQININDPVDLPKDFLIVFNSLLESMSSYSLSVQLAAYNCLLNLTEKLSELLLEQVNIAEKTESLEIFSVNLPHKLLHYMLVDDLDQLNIDKTENQIILIRCFLSWNIVLQLFSGAQSKLRAEISIFLSQNDRCFDKFLNFCFTFMPKNPVVNRKYLSFDTNNSFNLIYEEPRIFSQCIEKRSKFIIYHLSAYIFRRCMQVLPNLCRGWWRSLDGNSQQLIDSYVRQFLTKELFKIEFKQLKENVDKEFDDKLEIKAIPMIGEVTVKYNVSCDQSLEQLITLPNNYPIGNIRVEFKQELTVKIPHWKNWVGQMAMTLENQNGSIFDGVKLWKRNLDNHFNGIEECMICYSILHATKYTLPSMPCYQCKKKFHKDCMYRWFHSSTNPTCPNCRNVFYDGSQKSK